MKIFLSLLFIMVCFLSFCQFSIAADSRRVDVPVDLIQIFYDDLLSNKNVLECADIFTDSKSYAVYIRMKTKHAGEDVLSDTALIWKYLRQNKNLFLLSYISPTQTLQKAKTGYLFMPYDRNSSFFIDGNMSILIFAPLSQGGKDGIMKEIIFPLKQNNVIDENRHRYLLNLPALRINGIYFDTLFEFKKVKNMIEMLGFPSGVQSNNSLIKNDDEKSPKTATCVLPKTQLMGNDSIKAERNAIEPTSHNK